MMYVVKDILEQSSRVALRFRVPPEVMSTQPVLDNQVITVTPRNSHTPVVLEISQDGVTGTAVLSI